jgi:hypothetical protein
MNRDAAAKLKLCQPSGHSLDLNRTVDVPGELILLRKCGKRFSNVLEAAVGPQVAKGDQLER